MFRSLVKRAYTEKLERVDSNTAQFILNVCTDEVRSVWNIMSVLLNYQCISEFIEICQSESCLWQIKSKG